MGISTISSYRGSQLFEIVGLDKDVVDLSKIENAISNIGYQANNISANSEKYELLPACCKIGGMDKM